MSAAPFHLAWFVDGFRVPAWNQPWSGTSSVDWMRPGFFVDLANALERACFDFVLIEDSNYIPDDYGQSMEVSLKWAQRAPKHDPSALVSVLTQTTSRLGLVPTLSITEWRPYPLARFAATLDHFSGGRMGWNIVTGGSDLAAQNFGLEHQPEHDRRYDMAEEFVETACALWESWESDALVMDTQSGKYVDHHKVHPIHHRGEYFSSRGPLNTIRPPQGRPVLVQAGASPRGRDFASKFADCIATTGSSVDEMKATRDDLHRRLEGHGRKASDCKVLFLVEPIVGATDEDARETVRRRAANEGANLELNLSMISGHLMIDLSKFDLDSPLPADLRTNGHQGMLDGMIASGRSFRELVGSGNSTLQTGDFVGSPDTVAARMDEVMQDVGGDGFLICTLGLTRRYIAEITDGLVPALQRRGLTRSSYGHAQFSQNLLDF